MPEPLEYISFAPVVYMTFGTLLKPLRAFIICSIGAVLAQLINGLIDGSAVYLIAYLPGAFVARGLSTLFISSLNKSLVRGKQRSWKSARALETLILVIGILWEVTGYALIGIPYFMYVWGYDFYVALGWYLAILIDLIFVPVAVDVIAILRRHFQVEYLDGLLFKEND